MTEFQKKDIYYRALRIRMIEDAIAKEYPKEEMRTPTHLYQGQEAIAATFGSLLRKSDQLFAYYRSHGWYLTKGGSLNRMMGELFGKSTGCSKGFGGSMHLIDLEVGFQGTTALVAGAMPHAVGAAFSLKTLGTKDLALSCFGDAATEEGLFQESLMFAALRKLPVIFVCENNGLATNTWIQDRQPPVSIWERAKSFGVAAYHVDGSDAEAIFKAGSEAVERARMGQGPSFIECATYRFLEHCGHNYDVALGIRTMEEIEERKKRDPLKLMDNWASNQETSQWRDQINQEIEMAFAFACSSPFPDRLTIEDPFERSL